MFHAIVIGHDHHQVDRLTAELQPPASPCDGDRRGSAPDAAFGPAGSHTLAMAAAETDSNLHHRGNHRDALRIAHHLVRDCFVRSSHDFVQNFSGCIQAFVDVRSVFVIRGPRHAGDEQKPSAEHQETFRQFGTHFCHKRTSSVLEASNCWNFPAKSTLTLRLGLLHPVQAVN